MKAGDNVRVVEADLPVIQGELPYQRENRLATTLGLKPAHLQTVGTCLEVLSNGDVVFQDWQRTVKVTLPAKHVKVEENLDEGGVVLKPGDRVCLAVKNLLAFGTYLGPSNWKHHGCGWCELGARFLMNDGKKFSHYYPKGRLRL